MKQKDSISTVIIQSAMVFFFIYEVQPIGVPDILTSRKLVFFLSFALYIYKRNFKISITQEEFLVGKITKSLLILGVSVLLWTMFLIGFNSLQGNLKGSSILSRTILFIPFVPLICLFVNDLFDDCDQFMRAVMIATIVQSLIAIVDYFSYGMKVFMYNHFVLDTNYSYMSPYRAAGLGAGESLLSVNLFIGAVSTAYFLLQKKQRTYLYVLIYALISFALFLSGSTGFVLGIGLILLVLLYQIFAERKAKAFKIILFAIAATVIILALFPEFFSNIGDFQIYRKIKDVFNVGFRESNISTSLRAQEVAPLSVETIIGTSIYRGYSANGTFSRSDTGYLQSYFGYGLIMAVVFYWGLYNNMIKSLKKIKKRNVRFLISVFLGCIALVEAKEPFIHHFGLPFAFFMMCFTMEKEANQGIQERT